MQILAELAAMPDEAAGLVRVVEGAVGQIDVELELVARDRLALRWLAAARRVFRTHGAREENGLVLVVQPAAGARESGFGRFHGFVGAWRRPSATHDCQASDE